MGCGFVCSGVDWLVEDVESTDEFACGGETLSFGKDVIGEIAVADSIFALEAFAIVLDFFIVVRGVFPFCIKHTLALNFAIESI
jgi:hypothetical protein